MLLGQCRKVFGSKTVSCSSTLTIYRADLRQRSLREAQEGLAIRRQGGIKGCRCALDVWMVARMPQEGGKEGRKGGRTEGRTDGRTEGRKESVRGP